MATLNIGWHAQLSEHERQRRAVLVQGQLAAAYAWRITNVDSTSVRAPQVPAMSGQVWRCRWDAHGLWYVSAAI